MLAGDLLSTPRILPLKKLLLRCHVDPHFAFFSPTYRRTQTDMHAHTHAQSAWNAMSARSSWSMGCCCSLQQGGKLKNGGSTQLLPLKNSPPLSRISHVLLSESVVRLHTHATRPRTHALIHIHTCTMRGASSSQSLICYASAWDSHAPPSLTHRPAFCPRAGGAARCVRQVRASSPRPTPSQWASEWMGV